ncbi:unnamed protein product [Peniophora sp. CBMAI 1063]|nr:unnamed protein product [Peniophora sp. CBMAI 1063]
MSFAYDELKGFFPPTAEAQIRDDFKSRCVLCTTSLSPDQGICVPILRDVQAWNICERALYTDSCEVRGPLNGLLSCDDCCKFLADSEDGDAERLAILIPCLPLLVYVNRVLNGLRDKPMEGRLQTFDQILEDLEKDPGSTTERRAASPFLHCFQIQPLDNLTPRYPQETSRILLRDAPPSCIINGKSYRIIDTATVDPSDDARLQARTQEISISDSAPVDGDTEVNLWRIPRRSAGLFMGVAEQVSPLPSGDSELYKYLKSVQALSWYRRSLRTEEIPRHASVRAQFERLELEIESGGVDVLS